MSGPLTLRDVLLEEYTYLHGPLPPGKHETTQQIYELIHKLPDGPVALCLSGGGIRSATFNLGLLQGLAQWKLLGRFHYLSTVSGGGYIGSWLTAWISRRVKEGYNDKDVIDDIETTLAPRTEDKRKLEAHEISFLRRYRNHLSPNWKLLSLDTWTLIATYLRNLFLNWLVLLTFLLAIVDVPRVFAGLIELNTVVGWHILSLILGALCMILSIGYIAWRIDTLGENPSLEEDKEKWRQGFVLYCLVPMVLASLSFCFHWAWTNALITTSPREPYGIEKFLGFAIIVIGVGVCGGKLYSQRMTNGQRRKVSPQAVSKIPWWITFLGLLVSSVASGAVMWSISRGPFVSPQTAVFSYITFAPPLLLLIFLFGMDLYVGWVSRWATDDNREWKARLNAYVLIVCLLWVAVFGLVLLGPSWLAAFPYPDLLASVGGLSGLGALLLGFSKHTKVTTGGKEKESPTQTAIRWSLNILAPIGVLFLPIILSWLISFFFLSLSHPKSLSHPQFLSQLYQYHPDFDHAGLQGCRYGQWIDQTFVQLAVDHACILNRTPLTDTVGLLVILLVVSMVMSWLIDINRFSLHALYRDRLIRTFLGASNSQRKAHWFTDMDLKDNVEMRELAWKGGSLFHVVNVAVNLLSSREYAWQNRKAASFTITPLHCGSHWETLGYRDSKEYSRNISRRTHITLGTALAISGAAASPNMGYHSSPAVSSLMTLFNIRLGWWLGNPGKAGERTRRHFWEKYFEKAFGPANEFFRAPWNRSTPGFALWWWIREALGLTREDNAYVCLSDGGHFENLGLYEMVLRRCRCIVVSDAGCDPACGFEDLGNAIRKIRVDLGIDIEIDLDMVRPQAGQRLSRWHHAIGTIRYDQVDDKAPVGILVYIKASLTGNESADVREYAQAHGDFPHQTTGDQFFDEAQFESYRQLGEDIAQEVFTPIAADALREDPVSDASEMFYKLRSHWTTVPPGLKESFLEESKGLLRIEQQLRDDPTLLRYDIQLYPELKTILGIPESVAVAGGTGPTTTDQMDRSMLHLCHAQIQLMENVFLAVQLDTYHAHPLNRGWMNLFRRWAAAEEFQKLWPVLRGGFSKDFVDFAGYELNLGDSKQEIICEVTRDQAGNLQNPTPVPDWRGSAPTGLIDFEPVKREFRQEWTDETKHHDFLRMFDIAGVSPNPPIIVAVPPHGVKTNSQVFGVAFAVDAEATDKPEPGWRVFIWIRGAHRRLGIGGKLLDHLIDVLPPHPGSNEDRRLIVILPELSRERPGYALEKAGWLHFFGSRRFHLVSEKEFYCLERCDRVADVRRVSLWTHVVMRFH